jgi:hypothetical protein
VDCWRIDFPSCVIATLALMLHSTMLGLSFSYKGKTPMGLLVLAGIFGERSPGNVWVEDHGKPFRKVSHSTCNGLMFERNTRCQLTVPDPE